MIINPKSLGQALEEAMGPVTWRHTAMEELELMRETVLNAEEVMEHGFTAITMALLDVADAIREQHPRASAGL